MKNSHNPYNPYRYGEQQENPEYGPSDEFRRDPRRPGGAPRRPGGPETRKKSGAALVFLHVMELVTIGLSYLERSRIVRFLAAKLGLDVVVEVTDRFGPAAGHRLSTFVSLLIAEPALIAVLVTAVWILLNLIVFLILGIRRRRRRRREAEFNPGW